MEMYAPAFENCLDPRLGLPETLEEVLLNRTSFTQAYVEQQAKLNEQKFLAIARSHDMLKTNLEQSQRLRNNEIEARMTIIEEKVEHCIKKISAVLDRITQCESLSNVKTLLLPVKTKMNEMESKIVEQNEYFELNTNEVVKRVVAAIKEEQNGRQLFEEKMRKEKQELDGKLDLVFEKIQAILRNEGPTPTISRRHSDVVKRRTPSSSNQGFNMDNSPRYEKIKIGSPRNLGKGTNSRKSLGRSRSHDNVPLGNNLSPKVTSTSAEYINIKMSDSGRFKDANNMESPTNKINDSKLSSPSQAAKKIIKKLSSSKLTTTKEVSPTIYRTDPQLQQNIIDSLPIQESTNNNIRYIDKEYINSSDSSDDDSPPPPYEPWMKQQSINDSNRYSNATNIVTKEKRRTSGWGKIKSFFNRKKQT
eukprot:g1933.t1